MNETPSIDELQSLLRADELSYPSFTIEVSDALRSSKHVIKCVGLPTQVADWFRAVDNIVLEPDARRFQYAINQQVQVGEDGIRLGVNDLGIIVLDARNGCVVYVEPGGLTQLINTSIERFLYFVGRFNRSADCGFDDINQLLSDCREIDPAPLADPEGVWSVMLEEAKAGLY